MPHGTAPRGHIQPQPIEPPIEPIEVEPARGSSESAP